MTSPSQTKAIREVIALDPSHPLVIAMQGYLLAKIEEYRASMGEAMSAIYLGTEKENPDHIREALADYDGAMHLCLEAEDLAAVFFSGSQSSNEA